MIIHSIRLKNIKSYGAGPDGNGVLVPFQPGINRIAGQNGHGKTSLIEALGFALFFAEPVFEENFRIETYLLNHGTKTGEIDVTFALDDCDYRLERGVGTQSKRRAKIVQLADGSICAEGDREVAETLCRMLKVPSPPRLAELFSKLVGVKQGRLTWPFDQKPADAKRFFEPLLEVEVFRQCFDRLKPAVDQFNAIRTDHEKQSAVLGERIRERADSVVSLEAADAAVKKLADERDRLAIALEHALAAKKAQEGLKESLTAATGRRETARLAAAVATSARADGEVRLRDAEAAQGQVTRCLAGHAAFEAAEGELKALELRRAQRDALREQRNILEKTRVELRGKIEGLRQQEVLLVQQQQNKAEAKDAAADRAAQLQEELEASRVDYHHAQSAADIALNDFGMLNATFISMRDRVAQMGALAHAIDAAGAELSAWDSGKLEQASENERRAVELEAEANDGLSKAGGRRSSLSEQMEQIAGGVCPFLKDTCRQFDPGKVEADLSQLDLEIAEWHRRVSAAHMTAQDAKAAHRLFVKTETELRGKQDRMSRDIGEYDDSRSRLFPPELAEAVQRLRAWHDSIAAPPSLPLLERNSLRPSGVLEAQATVCGFVDAMVAWWQSARRIVEAQLQLAERARTDRAEKEATYRHQLGQVASIQTEIDGLVSDARIRAHERERLEAEVAAVQEQASRLDGQLAEEGGLDRTIDAHRATKEANKDDHENYLGAKSLADQRETLEERLTELRKTEADLEGGYRESDDFLVRARAAFNADALEAAQREYEQRLANDSAARISWEHAVREQERQRVRFSEWESATADRAVIALEIERCEAAIDLTELARKILRDAAPAVAQHLCTRIASRAQAVFNQINADPIELVWRAERFSLEVTPGDRRFAMLSGGEQTKLALAMTLAMVEEFSGLRFCIFDEPTYGIDAESRRKLADAVLQLHEAAHLDQLLLVSHDDAFEGKVEHTVLVKKGAATGTVVSTQ